MATFLTGLKIIFRSGAAITGLRQAQKAIQATSVSTKEFLNTYDGGTDVLKNFENNVDALEESIETLSEAALKGNITFKQALEVQKNRVRVVDKEIKRRAELNRTIGLGLKAARQDLRVQELALKKRLLQTRQIGLAIRVFREFRMSMSLVFRAYNRLVGGSNRATGALTNNMMKVKIASVSLGLTVQRFFAAAAGAITGLVGVKAIGGVNEFFSSSIRLASDAEKTRVTFDALIGDYEKSAELLRRIESFSSRTPFQKTDIEQASKRLLIISRDDIAANEKLFKLATNIAALKPGTTVESVAKGIVGATLGEFDVLKNLGIVLKADQFKNAGDKGGKAYSESVVKAIEEGFEDVTGGRGNTLVEKLSQTLFGKTSTLQDNVNELKKTIGEMIIDALDIKGSIDSQIKLFQTINAALKFIRDDVVTQDDMEILKNVPDIFIRAGIALFDFFDKVKEWRIFLQDKVVGTLFNAWTTFNRMSESFKKNFVQIGGVLAVLGLTGGTLIPTIASLALGLGGIAAVLGSLSIPGLIFGGMVATSIVPIMAILVGWTGAAAAAFILMRKEGETLKESVMRLGGEGLRLLIKAFHIARVTLTGFAHGIMPGIKEAWKDFSDVIKELRQPLSELFAFFRGTEIGSAMEFRDTAILIGKAFGFVLKWGTKLAVFFLKGLVGLIKNASPAAIALASDITQLGKSFFSIITGTENSLSALKTFMLATVDLLISPITGALSTLLGIITGVLKDLEAAILPFSVKIANQITRAIIRLENAQETVAQGLLTNIPINVEVEHTLQTTVEVDGEKLGESIEKNDKEKRSSGRGGDPLNAQELAFTISGDRSIINVVDLNDLSVIG